MFITSLIPCGTVDRSFKFKSEVEVHRFYQLIKHTKLFMGWAHIHKNDDGNFTLSCGVRILDTAHFEYFYSFFVKEG